MSERERLEAFARWCTAQYEAQERRRIRDLFLLHCNARRERLEALGLRRVTLHDNLERFAAELREKHRR